MASLLDPWRDRPVHLVSPLSVPEALQRLASGIGTTASGGRLITGRIIGDRLTAAD